MASSLSLFEAVGVELEYMIVDRETLRPRPIAERVLVDAAGAVADDIQLGPIGASNELAAHVLELKTGRPVADTVGHAPGSAAATAAAPDLSPPALSAWQIFVRFLRFGDVRPLAHLLLVELSEQFGPALRVEVIERRQPLLLAPAEGRQRLDDLLLGQGLRIGRGQRGSRDLDVHRGPVGQSLGQCGETGARLLAQLRRARREVDELGFLRVLERPSHAFQNPTAAA